MPLGDRYADMIGPVGNIRTDTGFEAYVDPESNVIYEVPNQQRRQAQQAVAQQAEESRSERQRQADAMRILNRIAGPAPVAPQEDPLLQIGLRNTRDPYRLRSLEKSRAAQEGAQEAYGQSMSRREKLLDQIMRSQQLERSQTFAESQTKAAADKEARLERESRAKLPSEKTQAAQKSAAETAALRELGAAPLGPMDIAAFAAQHPGEDPLAIAKEFRRMEQMRQQQGASAREAGELETAEPASLESIIRNVPGLGQALAGRVTPRVSTVAKERLFGKGLRAAELDAMIESLPPALREQLFPIRQGRFGLGQIGAGGGPGPSALGQLLNSIATAQGR